jgi:hypothetical protein
VSPLFFMKRFILASLLLLPIKIPIYIPIRLDYDGANAFLSNVRPQYIVQTGEMEFAEIYVSVTLPL